MHKLPHNTSETFLVDSQENENSCKICKKSFNDSSWGKRSETFGFCCYRCVSQACRLVRRHNVRGRDAKAQGKLFAFQWLCLLYAHNFLCAGCHNSDVLTLDHVQPLSKGGRNQIHNVQPLCIKCHRSKDNIPQTTRCKANLSIVALQKNK